MPRKSKEFTIAQQAEGRNGESSNKARSSGRLKGDDDDDDGDHYPTTNRMVGGALPHSDPEDESEDGWSDDSGKDSDVGLISPKKKTEPKEEIYSDEEHMPPTTRSSRLATSSSASKLNSYFTANTSPDDLDDSDDDDDLYMRSSALGMTPQYLSRSSSKENLRKDPVGTSGGSIGAPTRPERPPSPPSSPKKLDKVEPDQYIGYRGLDSQRKAVPRYIPPPGTNPDPNTDPEGYFAKYGQPAPAASLNAPPLSEPYNDNYNEPYPQRSSGTAFDYATPRAADVDDKGLPPTNSYSGKDNNYGQSEAAPFAAGAGLGAGAGYVAGNFNDHQEGQYDDEHGFREGDYFDATQNRGAPAEVGDEAKYGANEYHTNESVALSEAEKRFHKKEIKLIVILMVSLIVLAGVVGGIVGVVIGNRNKSNNNGSPTNRPVAAPVLAPIGVPTLKPTPRPTIAPTVAPSSAPIVNTAAPTGIVTNPALYDAIAAASPDGGAAILETGSPQQQAFLLVQSQALDLPDSRQIQRYALLTFFYSTDGESWVENTNWGSELDECVWYSDSETGMCVGEAVTSLRYVANGITGVLPAELSMLTTLSELYIKGASGKPGITGGIPLQLADLPLATFLFSDHNFTEPLPDSLFDSWSKITVLNIVNSKLPGTIPSLAGLTSATNLNFNRNKLTGDFPDISGLAKLVLFDVSENDLEGSLPSLAALTSLKNFNVGKNRLSGGITELSNLVSVKPLLNISYNQFSGEMPSSLNALTQLQSLVFNNNQLQGPCPDLSALIALTTFRIEFNLISGSVPSGTCTAVRVVPATTVAADCGAGGNVTCACCNVCCSANGCS